MNEPPAEIADLVRERIEARARRDWAKADLLRAQIEAAGWRIVDHGTRTSISRATPATAEIGGEVRYGSAAAVRSLLDEPATAAWSVVVVASEEPQRVSRLLTALRTHMPAGTSVVVVANDPSDAQAAALEPGAPDREPIAGLPIELLRTSAHLGYAAALNIGLRRAAGELVLIAGGTALPTGDALTPLAAALHDPAVAAAGGLGLVEPEPGELRLTAIRRLEKPAESEEVLALESGWLGFRRSDYRTLGPLDEHFFTPAWLDVWWTLRLRAGASADAEMARVAGEDAAGRGGEADGADEDQATDVHAARATAGDDAGASPVRRALAIRLPLEVEEGNWPPERTRPNRRNMYRVLRTFARLDDLV